MMRWIKLRSKDLSERINMKEIKIHIKLFGAFSEFGESVGFNVPINPTDCVYPGKYVPLFS